MIFDRKERSDDVAAIDWRRSLRFSTRSSAHASEAVEMPLAVLKRLTDLARYTARTAKAKLRPA